MGKLYLIPNLLADTSTEQVLPAYNLSLIDNITHFIVEDVRNARRFLRKCSKTIDIDKITFYELNKRTTTEQKTTYLSAIKEGFDMGVISEAGCPSIADPGSEIVMMAHRQDIEVIPLVGPSSILLALIASGLNGQSFSFLGYLPIKNGERAKKLKQIESTSITQKSAQIFIETPYRNNQMLADILSNCSPKTLLTIACNITAEDGFVKTYPLSKWKKGIPDLHKIPTIFILQGN